MLSTVLNIVMFEDCKNQVGYKLNRISLRITNSFVPCKYTTSNHGVFSVFFYYHYESLIEFKFDFRLQFELVSFELRLSLSLSRFESEFEFKFGLEVGV